MRTPDLFSSLFWMAISLGICLGGHDLGLGSLTNPGGGFMFFWVGVIMAILSGIVMVQAAWRQSVHGEMRAIWSGVAYKKVIAVLAALFIYAYLLTPLGFILATTLLMIFLFKAVEPQGWSMAILGAVISTLVAYGLFRVWLQCQLPLGLLGG